MRIVSLLPSATETLFALGLGSDVVAVTHECDFPPDAARLPIVTRSTLPLAEEASGGIEAAVALAASEGRSLYEIDTAAIRELRPDLVVAQDVCRVCAVSADEVAAELGSVRGVFLEWLDPPYRAGHWTPDLLRLAGIDDPLARAGVPSVAGSWAEVKAARPELLVLAPCGFSKERAEVEAALVQDRIDAVGASPVVVLDGSAYFNRPGPPLVDSLEVLVGARATSPQPSS